MKQRKNPTKDKPVNIRLEISQYDKAQVLAKRERRSMSQILRMSIESGLEIIENETEGK